MRQGENHALGHSFEASQAPGQPPYDCMPLDDLLHEREIIIFCLEHGPENEKEHRREQLVWYDSAIEWQKENHDGR